jgi:hypothetical protein
MALWMIIFYLVASITAFKMCKVIDSNQTRKKNLMPSLHIVRNEIPTKIVIWTLKMIKIINLISKKNSRYRKKEKIIIIIRENKIVFKK